MRGRQEETEECLGHTEKGQLWGTGKDLEKVVSVEAKGEISIKARLGNPACVCPPFHSADTTCASTSEPGEVELGFGTC